MAALNELIQKIENPELRAQIQEAADKIAKQKKFGLVFEEHLPECTPLYDVPVRKGSKVSLKSGKVSELYTVIEIKGEKALCVPKDSNQEVEFEISDLVSTAEFGEPIYPYLQKIDSVENAPDSDLWHTLIEADNYHALQLLEYLYAGKVDCIYIDPPYNKPNEKDWKYNNNYIDKSDQYQHSKWLSMMKKRLIIAKNLLSPTGCIFLSIDDVEACRLKLLCDEILGNNSFVAQIPWRKRTAKSDVPFGISQDYESILCYANEKYKASVKGKGRKYYETEDFPGRPWRYHDLTKQTTADERPNSYFTIVNPKTGEEYPANKLRTWAITAETFGTYYEQDRIIFPGDYDFLKISKPVLRYWKKDDEKKAGSDFGLAAASTYLPSGVGMSEDGTKELTEIFFEKRFKFPKPVNLIKHLIAVSTASKPNALILDFFAGSGTTLHAVNLLNAEDGGHRRCIMVTNNEVSVEEANSLKKQGYHPGDEEWEKLGIARYVTWPRTVCSIEGHDVNGNPLDGDYGVTSEVYEKDDEAQLVSKTTGKPIKKTIYKKVEKQIYPALSELKKSDGFASNCIYFKLGFLDKNRVSVGLQFKELLSTLWMKAGAIGGCPEIKDDSVPDMLILPENRMAILNDENHFGEFAEKLSEYPQIEVVYLVTDYETSFRLMTTALAGKHTYQLYRDYLDNFRINAGRNSR